MRDEEGPKGLRVFPRGGYVPQTQEEPEDSVGMWVKEGNGSTENEDIVFFLALGALIYLSPPFRSPRSFSACTHIPRPEDTDMFHKYAKEERCSSYESNQEADFTGQCSSSPPASSPTTLVWMSLESKIPTLDPHSIQMTPVDDIQM